MDGSDEFSLGDTVCWTEPTPMGHTQLKNETSGHVYSVFFQNHNVSPAILQGWLTL